MRSADVAERLDGSKGGRDDAYHPPIQVSGEERERRCQLDGGQDDRDPSPCVYTAEDVPFAGDVEARIGDSRDAVEEVQRAHDQQQDRDEPRASYTSGRISSRSAPWIFS